jgi:hypothetical protein
LDSQTPAGKWPGGTPSSSPAFSGTSTSTNTALVQGEVAASHQPQFAGRLVMAGVDLKTVQELMGHKTIAMTARYAHLAPAHTLHPLETRVRPESVSVRRGYKLGYHHQESREQ